MRTVITLAILLLITATALAIDPAPAIEWEKLYPSLHFIDVRETAEGNLVCAGWEVETGDLNCVFCYNSNGNAIWEYNDQTCPRIYVADCLQQVSDGSIIAVGTGYQTKGSTHASLAICKLTPNGNELWTKVYKLSDSRTYARDFTSLPDGGFAICGDIDPAEGMNQAWILRTDAQGDTLWTREWGWVMWDRARGILCVNSVIIVLCSGRLEGDPGGTYIVRYSMDGDLLSEYWIPELIGKYGFDMCEAADGGLLILTNNSPTIAHTDYYGNVDWYTSPPYWDRDTASYGWSIDTTMDGGIIYGGENRYQPPGNNFDIDPSGMIVRMDYEGNFFWSDYVYNSGCTAINSVRQLSQGGYIAAGYASGRSTSGGFLLRYAPELGIESGDDSPAVKITSVSPNPFSSSLSITCSLSSAMSASVTVYGLDGRIVDVVEAGYFPAGEHVVSWIPSSELASGCYLIRVQSDAGTDVRNCVLLAE